MPPIVTATFSSAKFCPAVLTVGNINMFATLLTSKISYRAGLGVIVNLMLLANAVVVVVTASRGAEFFIYSGRGKDGPTEEAASVCFFH